MLSETLRNIDYQSLCISDYNRRYILWLLPRLGYYLDIYRRAIASVFRGLSRPLGQTTLVDYGGGHGFLSLLAKEMGMGRVVYVDYNPDSVATVKAIADVVGFGPDIILSGDAATLRCWCEENAVMPDAVLGMDVVEHIYRLDLFFAEIFAINPAMRMVLTTGSNPCNPWTVRRLHSAMVTDEQGTATKSGFRAMRRQHLAEAFPEMDSVDLDRWADDTRGLTYTDAVDAVMSNRPPMVDRYNTCDPATGSWTERLLPLSEYRRLLQPYGARLVVSNGFYNTHGKGMKPLVVHVANGLLRCNVARCIAPFIVLNINAK